MFKTGYVPLFYLRTASTSFHCLSHVVSSSHQWISSTLHVLIELQHIFWESEPHYSHRASRKTEVQAPIWPFPAQPWSPGAVPSSTGNAPEFSTCWHWEMPTILREGIKILFPLLSEIFLASKPADRTAIRYETPEGEKEKQNPSGSILNFVVKEIWV